MFFVYNNNNKIITIEPNKLLTDFIILLCHRNRAPLLQQYKLQFGLCYCT